MVKHKIASVIVTYNRKELLVEALDSLLEQTYPVDKIIIVDNASSDGSKLHLERLGYLNNNKIVYKYLDRNLGGAGGFHHGLSVALKENIDWVSMSDDDAIFEKDYFENIIKCMHQNPEVHAFAGSVYENGELCLFHRGKLDNKINFKFKYFDKKYYEKKNFLIDIFSFVGCVINISIINAIGLPDQEYFIRNDDAEYALRVGQQTKILCVPSAKIDHRIKPKVKNDNNETLPDWKDYYDLRNHCFLAIAHSHRKALTYLYIFMNLFARGCYAGIKGKYKGHRKYRLLMLFDILKDVLNGRKGKNSKYMPNS